MICLAISLFLNFMYWKGIPLKDVVSFKIFKKEEKKDITDPSDKHKKPEIKGAKCELIVNNFKDTVLDSSGDPLPDGPIKPNPFDCDDCDEYYWQDSKGKCVAYDLDPRDLIPEVDPSDNTKRLNVEMCTENNPCSCSVPEKTVAEVCPS